jgi:hypothetical protein
MTAPIVGENSIGIRLAWRLGRFLLEAWAILTRHSVCATLAFGFD